MIKNNFRILKKNKCKSSDHRKSPCKVSKGLAKNCGRSWGDKVPTKNPDPRTTHHALRKAENNVPPLFFEKAGDKNLTHPSCTCCKHSRHCLTICKSSRMPGTGSYPAPSPEYHVLNNEITDNNQWLSVWNQTCLLPQVLIVMYTYQPAFTL